MTTRTFICAHATKAVLSGFRRGFARLLYSFRLVTKEKVRHDESYSLQSPARPRPFTVQDAPIYDKAMPQGLLTEHLRSIMEAIQPKTRQVTWPSAPATPSCAAPNCRSCP
jgi:hypothetical protein